MAIENLFGPNQTDQILARLRNFVGQSGMKDKDILESEILVFLRSFERINAIKSFEYYRSKTDIQQKQRLLNGKELIGRSNVKRERSVYRKFVNQKIGYLLSKTPSITTENEEYQKQLDEVFDTSFLAQFARLGKNAILGGTSFIYVYIDDKKKIKFKVFDSHTFKPFYADDEHLNLLGGVRLYRTIEYVNKQREEIMKVEEYTQNGVNYYELHGNHIILDTFQNDGHQNYLKIDGQEYNWPRVPIIPLRYNEEEQPLLDFVKTGIDVYNRIASTNADMIIDLPLLIYILKGYSGENLETFVTNLVNSLAVKVDEDGDVRTLESTLNVDAVEKTLERTRAEIYEDASAVDMQQASLGNDSGEKVKMRYADLDTDCNLFETEIQRSFKKLVETVNMALKVVTGKDFAKETVTLTLNRDIIINEKDAIEMVRSSVGLLDDMTVRENHPWYNSKVEERLTAEEEEIEVNSNPYKDTFTKVQKDNPISGKEK